MPLRTLSQKDRLRLIRFVCSFVWADLEVHARERDFVHKLVKRLHLDAEEAKHVEEWLKVPPKPEEVDPQRIPLEHRKLFLDTIKQAIAADGKIEPAERESLEVLEQLLR
jgi:uncharacterized tellurite resistance protein B-like protein